MHPVEDERDEGDRPTRRRHATRAQLITAARDLFLDTGSPLMSVEQIVRRAGFTRGAFYSNFQSVDEVLLAVYEHDADALAETVAGRVRAVVSSGGPVSLDAIADSLLAGHPHEATLFDLRAVVQGRARHDVRLRDELRAHARHLVDVLQPALTDALSLAGRTPTVAADVVTRSAIAAYLGTMAQAELDESSQLRRVTLTAVLHGLTRAAR